VFSRYLELNWAFVVRRVLAEGSCVMLVVCELMSQLFRTFGREFPFDELSWNSLS
jgi:hypothetical protein